jgi:hypothetical protein
MNVFINILLILSVVIGIVTLFLLQKDQQEHFQERIWDTTQRCTQKSLSPYNPSCPSSNLNFSSYTSSLHNDYNVILRIGEKLTSPSGKIELYFKPNGNLVLQRNNYNGTYSQLWQSETAYCLGSYSSSDSTNTKAFCDVGTTIRTATTDIVIPFVEEERPDNNVNVPPTHVETLATTLVLYPIADNTNGGGELQLVSDTGLTVKSLAQVGLDGLELQIRDDGTMQLVQNGTIKKIIGKAQPL